MLLDAPWLVTDRLHRLGSIGDAGEPRLPRDRVPVARVPDGVADQIARELVEVRESGLIERSEPTRGDQLVHLGTVRHDDEVLERGHAGLQVRLDHAEEAGVVLDRVEVVHVDARLRREEIERAVPVSRGGVDVVRPVGEVQPPGLPLPDPSVGRIDLGP